MKPLPLLLIGLVIAGAVLAVLVDPPGEPPAGRVVRYADAPDWDPVAGEAGDRWAGDVGDVGDDEAVGDEAGQPPADETLDGLPLTVEVVDGTTGGQTPVRGVSLVAGERAVPLDVRGGSFHLSRSPFHSGERIRPRFRIDARPGWVVVGGGLPQGHLETRRRGAPRRIVGRFTEALAADLVIWPELPVEVRVVRADVPVAGVEIDCVLLGDVVIAVTADPTDAGGRTRLRGVPRVPGEVFQVVVEDGESALVRLDRTTPSYTIPVDLDVEIDSDSEFDGPSTNWAIGIGGGGTPQETARDASLRVKVIRHDGSPAAGVRVVVATAFFPSKQFRTDDRGVTTILDLRSVPTAVSVREPGFLFGDAEEVHLVPHGRKEVTLREDPGRSLEVLVLDHEDRPVPGAVVDPRHQYGMPILAVVDGVQRLTLVADAEGRVTIPRIPTGPHEIAASYGSRSVRAEAAAGESLLVLRLPEP